MMTNQDFVFGRKHNLYLAYIRFLFAVNEFDIQFYLVAILFIIFDLEIAFLFPWAVSLTKTCCSSADKFLM